jgi:hypothetical protein
MWTPLEDKWRARLESAAKRYSDAKAKSREAASEQQAVPNTDGALQYRLALRNERLALSNYTRTLFIYSKVVTDGVEPEEAPANLEAE